MSAGEKGGSTPTLAPENYKTRFASACALYRNGTDWYKGSGITRLHTHWPATLIGSR